MIAIRLRFTAGRYHATDWEHQVNEGTVEWPPSPWRLCRALVAGWWRAPEAARPAARRLIERLAGVAPSYALPPTAPGHTRHYVPNRGKHGTLIFDAFLAVGGGAPDPGAALLVGWPGLSFEAGEREALAALLEHLAYLGRAEAWVEARVVEATPEDLDARPLGPDDLPERTVALLCPPSAGGYASWRRGFLDAKSPDPRDRARRRWERDLPADLWALLNVDTPSLQRRGWSAPPASSRVRYGLPTEGAVRHRASPSGSAPRVDLARYNLVGVPLPRLERAVSIGDLARRALMGRARREDGTTASVFSGRDAQGAPRDDGGHAYFLPVDEDGDGHLDHLLVWARAGLDEEARAALEGLRSLPARDDALNLLALGVAADMGTTLRAAEPGRSPALGPARVWVSHTPFVLFRHPKRKGGRWRDTPEDQLALALSRLGLPAPIRVDRLEAPVHLRAASQAKPWHRYYRERRRGGGSRGGDRGYGFRITFEVPVSGPIAVGYGAHYGLGLMLAEAR